MERLRQEKTKYLSVIGSIIGAALGIIATSINHALKRRDFKELAKMIESQNLQNSNLPANNNNNPTEMMASIAGSENKTIASPQTIEMVVPQKSTETQTDLEMKQDKIVEYISVAESNLEYKMKVNALTTVAATYALIAITLPIIIRFLTD